MALRPLPPDPPSIEHPVGPEVNHDASLYVHTPLFAGAVSARSCCMADPASVARLVATPRCIQRPAPRTRRAVDAVDVAPIAITADQRLNAAVRLRTQEKPGLRQPIMLATAAIAMRPPMAWTRAAMAAKMPLQSCLCTVCGAAPKQNWPVMDRRRACLPTQAGSSASDPNTRASFPRPLSLGLPRWVHRNLPPPSRRCARRALRAGGGSLLWTTWTIRGAEAHHQPPDNTSANSYEFWPASTGSSTARTGHRQTHRTGHDR